MLNPSTADADEDDPTIRKCVGFADRNGFGSIRVVNLFAFRARDPQHLKDHRFPGADSYADQYLRQEFVRSVCSGGAVCCAWGTKARWPRVGWRAAIVRGMMIEERINPKALRILADGTPSHPLMLAYSCKLQDYNPETYKSFGLL